MKVLLLCFLSGVFLTVVHAKPSSALMRELIALEKYLEKKEGSEGADGQNEMNEVESLLNQDVGQNDGHKNLVQVEENKPTENGKDKPKNENNNNGGDETNTAEGSSGAGDEAPHAGENKTPTGQEVVVPPAKPEDVPPTNAEESSGPSQTGDEAPHEEESSTASGEGEGEKPQEGNRPSPSEGQVEKGRDQICEVLDEETRKIKDAVDKLSTLCEEFHKQFQNDDHKFKELEDKDQQTKEKTKEILGQLKTVLKGLASAFGLEETPSVGKKSVRENAPARSHISDTEFLNMLHSLLTYS